MFRRRSYWIPSRRWQLEDWLLAWQKRTGRHIANLKRKNTRQLYALYFSIMDEYEHRRKTPRSARTTDRH